MRFLSVCSGIEAASVAWNPLGWKAAAFAEIEPFPCAVLANHYPDVPNRGDMTNFEEWPLEPIDLLCGGTPCQSFSVAGLRKGLSDPRGNLMLTYLAIAARYRPRWLVWENVPGVLSSWSGADETGADHPGQNEWEADETSDFSCFLAGVEELGYGWAYRSFDAQFAGLAQRRERVFVVGCLGGWRGAAAVLLERHGLQGHPAPSREARTGTAVGTLAGTSPGGGWRVGADEAAAGQLIPSAGFCLNPRGGGGGRGFDVAHALTGEAFDASEAGTGRGTPLVPIAFGWQNSAAQGASASEHHSPTLDKSKTPAIALALRGRDGGATAEPGDEVGNALRASSGGGDKAHVLTSMQVRRLTPRECERLQGFPDDYTLIPYRGKPAADGPRYKALGNSWAVPDARWIGRRIDRVDAITKRKAA